MEETWELDKKWKGEKLIYNRKHHVSFPQKYLGF